VADWGWKPVAGQSGSYEGTGTLAGRATITKETGARGGTKGFVLTLDGTKHSMGKKASFDHADKLVQDNQYGYVPPAADAGGGAVQSGPRGGKYIEGPGGSKQYVKSLEGAPMNPYNNSKRPLNWSPPKLDEYVEKSIGPSHDSHSRAGTPPTRRGTFHGHVPNLRPNLSGPELYLETPMSKAIPAPPDPNIRRAALDGAFAKAMGLPQVPLRPEQQPPMPGMPPAGPQGSAPGVPAQGGAGGVPGMGQAPAGMPPAGPPQQQQPMAMTPEGMPIMPDPFAPQHADFQAPDHQMAQMQHEQAGQMAPPQAAQQHQQAAQAHGEMGKDAQSPMERGGEKFGQGPAGQQAEMPPVGQGKPPAPPQAGGEQVNPPMPGADAGPPGGPPPPGAEAGPPPPGPPGAEAGPPPPGPPGAGGPPPPGAPPPVNPPMAAGGPPPPPPGAPPVNPPMAGGPPPMPGAGAPPGGPGMPPVLAAPKPPPMPPMAAQMQPNMGQPPMGTPQGEAPMGQQGASGGEMDQGKPQAPPQPEGFERQGPKPGMSERPPGAGAESEMGAGMGGTGSLEDFMQSPEVQQNPEMMTLLQQFMAGMEAPSAPTPGSSSVQEPAGAPKKQFGQEAPPTHAGNQKTEPEESAQKSLASTLGWN
jgi:hypothetical protein